MIELTPPMVLLERAAGMPTNFCTSACVTLQSTYSALGITAHPRAVDLMVINKRTDQRTMYGRPDPSWSGNSFNGHCVLWLPGSRRFVDPTVQQFPTVRRYGPGPICGRMQMAAGTPGQQSRLAAGELIPGAHVAVGRGDLTLLYTTVEAEYDDVVASGDPIRENLADLQRIGRSLAMQTLALLSQPEIIERTRQAVAYPRVLGLLDVLAGAEFVDGDDELRAVLSDDHTRTPRRLDEVDPPA